MTRAGGSQPLSEYERYTSAIRADGSGSSSSSGSSKDRRMAGSRSSLSSQEKQLRRRHTIAPGDSAKRGGDREAAAAAAAAANGGETADLDVAHAAALDCLAFRSSFGKIQGLASRAMAKLEGIAEAAQVIETNGINAVSKQLADLADAAAAPPANGSGKGSRFARSNSSRKGSAAAAAAAASAESRSKAMESAIKANLLASAAHQKTESNIQDLAKMMERIIRECSENKESLQEASESFKELSQLSRKASETEVSPSPSPSPGPDTESVATLQSEMNILKDIHRIEMDASDSQHRDEIAALKMGHEREIELYKMQLEAAQKATESYMNECQALRDHFSLAIHPPPLPSAEVAAVKTPRSPILSKLDELLQHPQQIHLDSSDSASTGSVEEEDQQHPAAATPTLAQELQRLDELERYHREYLSSFYTSQWSSGDLSEGL